MGRWVNKRISQVCPGMAPSREQRFLLVQNFSGFLLTPQGEIFSKSFSKICNLETRIFMNM